MATKYFVFVGLGNPGDKYKRTRHNVGSEVIDSLAAKYRDASFKKKFSSLVATIAIGDFIVILMKPQTFMNLSGPAVQEASHFYQVNPENICVVYDDLDLALGDLRIRKFGGSGGHNGMVSIIGSLGSDKFPRFRIGIGRGNEAADHVLSEFSRAERITIEATVLRTREALECLVLEGIDAAMNRFNKKDVTRES